MKKKTMLGQFYTTNSEYIIGNLVKDLNLTPTDIVIEPFVGNGDLLIDDINESVLELYDVDPQNDKTIKQDTLITPPDYKGKYVITNPPYLAKNKNKDKTHYDKYNTSDLYKCSILSMMEAKGGILIIPLNFLCDEDDSIRTIFFNTFKIININIFEETVFDDTTYTICSFSFLRRNESDEDNIIQPLFLPSGQVMEFTLKEKNGYKIGNSFYNELRKAVPRKIERLRKDKDKKPNSRIYLRAIDTGSEDGRIGLELRDHFYGKDTDRTFATIILDKDYSEKEQELICDYFNKFIEHYRNKYNSLFLTNYRNSTSLYARKRIGFDTAYRIISYIIDKKIDKV